MSWSFSGLFPLLASSLPWSSNLVTELWRGSEREGERFIPPRNFPRSDPLVHHVSLEAAGTPKKTPVAVSPTVHLLFKQPLSYTLPPTPESSTCTLPSKERRKERYTHHRDWVAGGGGRYWFFPNIHQRSMAYSNIGVH